MSLYKIFIYLLTILFFYNPLKGQCTGCNLLFNSCETVINNYQDCSENDTSILQDIIEYNSLEHNILYLGYQEWNNGRLKSIILMNSNIYNLPNSFGGLSNLEGLDLEFNFLTTLPDSFGNLVNLKYLDLSSNQIESLPDTFYDLVNLQTLGLYNNQLNTIQNDIGQLLNLNFVNLSFNQLIDIPTTICSLQNILWNDSWSGLNYSYIYNNSICPPYPECIEEYVGYQNTQECNQDCIFGDINNDTLIDILDIIALINHILINNYENCSDNNNDNELNILDIIILVNLILSS